MLRTLIQIYLGFRIAQGYIPLIKLFYIYNNKGKWKPYKLTKKRKQNAYESKQLPRNN